MISNCCSVAILCIVLNFSWNLVLSAQLKFLLISQLNVFRCSKYEYLIINDWDIFDRSKIRCPKQNNLFQNPLIPIYDYSTTYMRCNDNEQQLDIQLHAFTTKLVNNKLSKFDENEFSLLTSDTTIDNQIYSSRPERDSNNKSAAVLHSFSLNWRPNNIFVSYTKFNTQPTICRRLLNFQKTVVNRKCTDDLGYANVTCYNDLLADPPMKNINWTFVFELSNNAEYYSPNWKEQGGFYVDLRSFRTTTTSVSERLFL